MPRPPCADQLVTIPPQPVSEHGWKQSCPGELHDDLLCMLTHFGAIRMSAARLTSVPRKHAELLTCFCRRDTYKPSLPSATPARFHMASQHINLALPENFKDNLRAMHSLKILAITSAAFSITLAVAPPHCPLPETTPSNNPNHIFKRKECPSDYSYTGVSCLCLQSHSTHD